jgi:hypothetical protein
MSVSHQHTWVAVATDGRYFWDALAALKEPAHSLMAKVMEAKVRYPGPSP